ncbi:MAG: HAD-IC family P-type ATPase [Pseudomonadota bacterium]|nr:HAD-IC family P-type ATPase [Pseudomonadota bacterium]
MDQRHVPHAVPPEDLFTTLESSPHGLPVSEAAKRLQHYGPNALPRAKADRLAVVFLHQFLSPLIYILLAAALVSALIGEHSDAVFIFAVLLLNAVIGTAQEYSAQKAATALQEFVPTRANVLRQGEAYEVDAAELVPGDLVLLEPGDKVPVDLRLVNSHDLEVDESILTGESLAAHKLAHASLDPETPLAERVNMVYAGTLVSRGRGRGIATATGLATEIGKIATAVIGRPPTKPPLLLRMERFTVAVAVLVGIAVLLLAAVSMVKGEPVAHVFLQAVALAVSAIPEGLPVALTVALAIGMRRMARRNVIVRKLIAVEALGSCTYIASDKTGTLTVNQLTACRVALPDLAPWEITGEGVVPEGTVITPGGSPTAQEEATYERLCLAAVLSNEGFLGLKSGVWTQHGDAVDVALLVMAHKQGTTRGEACNRCQELDSIPFESERLLSASLNQCGDDTWIFVKGALERLLPLCGCMATVGGDRPLEPALILRQAQNLAEAGFRVLALASGPVFLPDGAVFSEEHLLDLTLLGLVGMIDPLRPEAAPAVAACADAGVKVAMISGDHPATALALSRELGLAQDPSQVVTGAELRKAANPAERVLASRVFARVEPQQKQEILEYLQSNGQFVAMTGDGANDAPALRGAHVGVAMGKSGTDLARETADLILTDDNFASIVAGIEEGRVAYANVRKVIFLLISTGAAEIVLFALSVIAGLPIPLLAVQLLWLNLVTNGIQDVALAFEPAEGDELKHPPRPPREPIFNRLMVERVVISAMVIGALAFSLFQWLLILGYSLEEARNGTLLLMVLFENVQVFNSRSETRSAFRHNPMRNPLLLFGTLIAQAVHIGAMYTPWIRDVLGVQPVSLEHWFQLLLIALSILVVMEAHKWLRTLTVR